MDLLKEHDNMQTKEQEFIDHTLLAPEYIRESNNFIMDLIETPVIYSKNLNAENPTTEFSDKEELHFHSSIYHFVQKHTNENTHENENNLSNSQPIILSVRSDCDVYTHKQTNNFNALNDNFLNERSEKHQKSYCRTESEIAVGVIEQFPTLSLLNQNEHLTQPNTIEYGQVVRKILPHKKRISRKLKIDDDVKQAILSPFNNQAVHDSRMSFNCEICEFSTASQIQFFTHLKEHYEPTTSGTVLATMKTSLDSLELDKDCTNFSLDNKKETNVKFDEVLQDINLNFNNFHNVNEPPGNEISKENTKNIKEMDHVILKNNISDNSSSLEKNQLKQITVDPIEFSDTEDMLEGIRNVVDKVSIEDTCDNIDLMEPNCIRAQWFGSNNNFNDCEESLSGQLRHLLNSENVSLPNTDNTFVGQNVCINNLKPYCRDIVNTVIEPALNVNNTEHNFTVDSKTTFETNVKKIRKIKSLETSNRDLQNELVIHQEHTSLSNENGKSSKKFYSCLKCNREFNSNNALKYHARTHTGIRPHQCDICGRSFFTQGALKSHLTTHSGDKPYECEHCQRKFRQWGDLKCHIISIHSGEKTYQCEYCGKSFSRRYSLVLHRRIHTSERNYKCEFCSKTFRASIYLQNHRKIHTGEKPYSCDICSKKFRVSGDLRRHKRMHERKALHKQRNNDNSHS